MVGFSYGSDVGIFSPGVGVVGRGELLEPRIPAFMELLRGIREPTYAFIDSTLDRLRFTVYRSLSVLGIA